MSSSFTPVPIAAIILAYQSARTLNSCAIAASVMFSYDYILSLGREYQYVWKSGKSRASRLPYLYIRYSYLVFGIVGYVTVPPVSDKSCTVLTWLDVCIQFLNLIGPPVLTTLRAYVLSGQNKVVGGITLTLGLVPFFVNVTSAYLTPPINLPPPDNCFGLWMGSGALKLGLTIGSRSCAVLLDVIAIVVTWRATRSSHRLLKDSFQRSSLQHVMWKNGNIYFFTLLSINTLDLILQALSITFPIGQGNYVTVFLEPITAVLNCHFLLDLYETNARLERGGSSFSQSHPTLSLHFTGIGSEGADAPEGSGFLSSFAGPIHHSFLHGDTEDAEPVDDDESGAGPSEPAQATTMMTAGAGIEAMAT